MTIRRLRRLRRRLQPGYHPIGAVNAKEGDKVRARYCQRCEEMFGVQARLGPRIMPLDNATGQPIPKPSDYDLFLECRNCGTVYPKHETRIEADIGPIKEPMTGPKGKVQAVEKKDKRKRFERGSNPRLRSSKWEIKDNELNAELKDGSVLLSYTSKDPTEPTLP
jgi:hypothetical protein